MMLTQVYISVLLEIQHDPDPAFAGPGSRAPSGVGSTAKDLEPPYLRYQEADPVKKDRTTTLSRAPHLGDNVHQDTRTVLETFPAGSPRGSWPAEEFAAARRNEGQPGEVVMDLPTDSFHVVVKAGA
jgi:hypothetical protein